MLALARSLVALKELKTFRNCEIRSRHGSWKCGVGGDIRNSSSRSKTSLTPASRCRMVFRFHTSCIDKYTPNRHLRILVLHPLLTITRLVLYPFQYHFFPGTNSNIINYRSCIHQSTTFNIYTMSQRPSLNRHNAPSVNCGQIIQGPNNAWRELQLDRQPHQQPESSIPGTPHQPAVQRPQRLAPLPSPRELPPAPPPSPADRQDRQKSTAFDRPGDRDDGATKVCHRT